MLFRSVVNNSPNICTGDNTDIDVSSNVAGATFSWTVTDLNGLGANTGTDVGPNTGINIQDNLINTGTETDSVIYHITPTGPAPTFIPGATQDIKVYVYPEPQALPINHLDSICDGTATDIEMAADVAGSTFTWIVNDPSGTSGAIPSGSAVAEGYRITQTLDNPGNAPITVDYIITPTGPALGSCPGDPVTVEVVVDPTPVANITNTTPEICSREFTDITMNASVANSEFTWIMANPKGTGAVDGSGLIGDKINQQLFNSTQTPVDIIWEIQVNGPGSTACPGISVFEDVTVNPLPNTTPITGVDTVCEQTPNIIFQTDVEADSYFEWSVPASLGTRIFGGSGTGSNAVVITAADIPGPGYVTDSLWVFETNVYGCTNDTLYKPLTLIPYPAPSVITGDDEVCAYSTHTYSVPDNPGSTYQWFIPSGAGFVTDPSLNTVDVTFGLLSGQVRVTETTTGGCNTDHIVLNVTVNQLPVSTLNADKTAICDGELVTFTAGPVADVSNYEFFLNGVSQQSGAANTWSSSTLANDDTITVNVTSTDGCSALAPPVIMTVNPDPTVTLTSSAAANTICAGESVTFEATSADAVLYNFYLNGVSQQSGPLYFWNTAAGAITDGDEVYVEVQNASGCWGASDTITTTVNPLPVANIDGDHNVCPGTTVDIAVTVTTGVSPFDITIDNGVGTFNGYLTGTPVPVTPAFSTTYTLTEITDANGCTSTPGPNITGSAVVTHLDTVQILTQPKPAEVCEGLDTSFTVGAIGAGRTYEWFTSDTEAGPYTAVPASNVSTLDIIAPTDALDGDYYYVVVSGTCDSEISDTVQLSIQYDPVAARDPFDAAVCEGLPTGFGVDAGITENPVFQWYLSTDNGFSWVPLLDTAVYTGTNTDSLNISSASSRFNGYQYYAEISGICGSSASSAEATLTVYERPEILEQPLDTIVCEGNTVAFGVNPGGTTNAIFQWQVDMRGGAGWEVIGEDSAGVYDGFNQDTLEVLNPTSRFDQYRYRVTVSGTCTPPQTSGFATLTVNEVAEIITPPSAQVICEEQSTVFTVNAGKTSAPSYNWEVDMGTGFNTIGADTAIYSGHNSSTLILGTVPSTYNGYLYRVTVGGICPATEVSPAVLLTVNQLPEIAAPPENDTVCENDQAEFTVDPGVTTIPTYQWQVNQFGAWINLTAADETSGDYTGVTDQTLLVNDPDISYNNCRYRVILSGACTPPITSDAATLIIDRRPEILIDPVDRSVCKDSDIMLFVNAGATTQPGYRWEYSSNGGAGWNDAATLPEILIDDNDTLEITAITSDYDGYLFRANVSGKCPAEVPSAAALISIIPGPEITLHPQDVTACEQESAIFTVDPGITDAPAYVWQYFNGSTWLNVPSTIYSGINSDTLRINAVHSGLNGTRYRVVVSGTCAPDSISEEAVLTVTENAEIMEQPVNAAICEGSDTVFTASAGVTTNPQYQWYVDDNSGGGFAPVTNVGVYSGANASTLVITGAPFSMDGYTYQLEVTGDCGAPEYSNIVELTVYKAPEIVEQPQDTATCELNNVSFTIDVGASTAPQIQWYENSGSGMMPLTEGGGYVGTNSTTLQIFGVDSAMTGYTYEATVTNSCGGPLTSDEATLTVYAAPQIWAQPVDATICEGDATSFTVVATGYDLDYEWFVDDGTTSTSITDGGIYSGQGTATLQVTGADRNHHLNRYYVRITGECQPWAQSNIAFLYVDNPPEIQVEPENDTICEFGTANFSVNATGGGLTYQWFESTDGGSNFTALSDVGFYIGTQQANLTIFNVDRSYDTNQYRVVASGTCTPDQPSVDVSLTVQTPPVITTVPVDLGVCDGEPAVFSVVAEGSDLQYQWKVNRNDGNGYVNIPDTDPDYTGALTPTLTKLTTDALTENGYSFRVQVSGPCTPAQLTDPVLLNISSLPEIVFQPEDDEVCEGGATQFSASASGPDLVYQWMVSTDDGNTWTALANGGVYEGADSDQLTINNTTNAMNGNRYRLDISSSCATAMSDVVVLTVWANPTANITGDLPGFPQICGGELLTIDGNPSGGSGNYTTHLWSGDVLHVRPTNQRTAEFQTRVKGDYNINYTVTDDNGCFGQASVVIQNFRPTALFSSDATPSCGDLTVNFTNKSSADAVSYDWDFDNGATSTEEHPTQSFDNLDPTGLVAYYNVSLVATDAQGCKDTALSVVTIYPKVDPEITATPTSGCQPLEVLLETRPGAAAYLWDFGDGTGENGSYTAYHVYSNLGTATKTFETVLQTTSAYGCTASDTVEIAVDPVPLPNFTVSPDIQVIPESGNAPVTFTNLTADGPWTFEYDFGDGSPNYTTNSFADVDHVYTAAGIYSVTLYTYLGECIDSVSTVVTVNPRPPVAGFTSITEGCHPLEIAFTNTSKYADSYTWQFGDGSVSREENPVHVFYQPGEYTVKLIASGPGGTDQASVVITVHPTPQVFFNYAPDSVFVNDKPVRFFNLTSYAEEYYWDFGDVSEYDDEVDSENNSTLVDPVHVYMYEGWKDVLLIASNPNCVDSLFIPMAVKVIPAGELRFPNIFRPGDSPVSGINVNDLADAERNKVFFPGVNRQVQEYRLYIYNRWGELIFETDDINTGWDGFIQGRKAAQGVYIWKVTGIYSNGSPFSDAGDVTLVWQ